MGKKPLAFSLFLVLSIAMFGLEDSETLGLAVVSVKYHSKP